MTPSPARAFPWILTVVTAAALVVLVSLGVWQVQRLAWKQALIARIDAAQAAVPIPLDQALARPDPEFTRVVVTCRGLDRARFVSLRTLVEGEAGVRLVSLCSQDVPLLVDRGFVSEGISARPPQDGGTMPVVVRGVVRRGEPANSFTPPPEDGLVYVRDIGRLADALDLPSARRDLMIVAETSSNPEWQALRPVALPEGLSNNHLGYAITWFGLAAALIGVYLAMLYRRYRA
ncbi:MAG: SURF1 family protein [Caulobacterales bacterium]|nr:SURF1 family protein [Caulobacterales bacterium]